jgi:glycosyltransferase involved in cell wall biosynthesis
LIVAAARLAPVKRFELLLDAAAEARATVPELRVRILGEGPTAVDLRRWIRDHGAEEWVELAGHVSRPRLRDHYREAWVVASASLAEGWGLSLTEAAACGTPAVATDIRGHRSSVLDRRTGVLVPPDRLGRALADVLSDARWRAELAENALARARTLTWDATSLGILRVFHQAVVSRARRSREAPRTRASE